MACIEKRTHNNTTCYRAKVRLKGFPAQTASFQRLTDAKEWAKETEVKLREGQYFKTRAASKYTLAEAIDRYIESTLPQKPKMIESQKPQLLWWKTELGQYSLFNISPALINDAKNKLAKGTTRKGSIRSPSTVNRYMAALSHLFTIAIERNGAGHKKTPWRVLADLKSLVAACDFCLIQSERLY